MYDPPISSSKVASTTPPQLPTGTGVYILWKSIEEWSQLIYDWVSFTDTTCLCFDYVYIQADSTFRSLQVDKRTV